MRLGKYFEHQFVKSFHATCIGTQWFILRLKDIGAIKRADIGDYIIFYENAAFNIELKSRKNGIIYPSEIKTEYMQKQIEKWKSFKYKEYRIPLYIIKNSSTKELGVFAYDEFLSELSKGRIDYKSAKTIIKFDNYKSPYNIKSLIEMIYSKTNLNNGLDI